MLFALCRQWRRNYASSSFKPKLLDEKEPWTSCMMSAFLLHFFCPLTKVKVRARFLFTIYNISCCVMVTMNFHYFFHYFFRVFLSVWTRLKIISNVLWKANHKKPNAIHLHADIWSICSSARKPTTQFKIAHARCDYCRLYLFSRQMIMCHVSHYLLG